MLTHADLTAYVEGGSMAANARLDAALDVVRNYCDWHIAGRVSQTFTVDAIGQQLFLPTLQLVSVDSVTQGGVAIDPATVTSTRWGVIGRAPGHAYAGHGQVTITITHGYEDLPPDVKDVVLRLAHRGMENPAGRERSQVGAVLDVWPQTLSDADKQILDAYRIPVLA